MDKVCKNCKYLELNKDEDEYVCSKLKMRSYEEDNSEMAVATDYEYYAADLIIKQPERFYCAEFATQGS